MHVTVLRPIRHAVSLSLTAANVNRKDYRIGTLHYNWPMSVHASQAFSTYTSSRDCTDSEHLPVNLTN